MSDFLEATIKNPRWWATLPFLLFLLLPLVAIQMTARLVAFLAHTADKQLEVLGKRLHQPVFAWWRESAERRQEDARLRTGF